MKKTLRRALVLLLMLTLLAGAVPAALAAETAAPVSDQPYSSTDPPTTEPTPTEPPETEAPPETTEPPEPTGEETTPTEPAETTEPAPEPSEATEPSGEPEEPTVPEEIVSWELEEGDALTSYTDFSSGIAPQTLPAGTVVAVSSKVSWYVGNTEFWWYHEDYGRMSDKCSTSSAVYFKLSDGRIGFCTQCFKDSVEGNYSPGGWYRWIDSSSRRCIAKILTYGAPNNGDTSDAAIKATALAIWDAAAGYYTMNGTQRGHGTPPFYANTSGTIRTKYDEIMAKVQKHGAIPSFAAKSRAQIGSGQTITLTYDRSSGTYKGSATDTNGVLADFNFTSSISGLSFSKSGNTLNITATAAAAKQLSAGVTIQNRGHEVEVGPDSCTILASSDYGTEKQLIVILDDPIDPVPCYFKLLAANPTGDIEITKTMSGGGTLSGYTFCVYSDAACTKLVASAVSDANGKARITGLDAGTYYVKERDDSETYPWIAYDQSVKVVTVTAGATATTGFTNTGLGDFVLRKRTNTGKDVAGWKFDIFSDAAMTDRIRTIATNLSGNAYSGYLRPGTYYVREVDDGTHPDWTLAEAFNVTVYRGQDTYVDVTNIQNGRISVRKATNTGRDLGGWQFGIYSDAGYTTLLETMTTDDSGAAVSGYLAPGTYYVRELTDTAHPDWTFDTSGQEITVIAGETAETTFTNRHNGRIRIVKDFPETGRESAA